MSKFEQLLDFLVNEDHDKANELFHEIVVEKSREIYENLIAEEEDEAEEDEAEDDAEDDGVDESYYEEDETVESMFGEEEEEDFPVQDQTDDFEDDTMDSEYGDADELGGDDEYGDEEDLSAPADKGDIQSVEDALEELKAQFEKILSDGSLGLDDEGEEDGDADEMPPMDGSMGDDETDDMDPMDGDMGDEEDEKGVKESRVAKTQGERMREYIEKVTATMDGGFVGARTGETDGAAKEGKSTVSSGSGKPTSGATAHNIAQGSTGTGEMSGTSPNADKGSRGLVGATKGEFTKPGTHNVNNVKSGIKTVKPVAKPGNKEFGGVGAHTGGDKAGQTGSGETKSPLTGAPNRAK